MLGSRKINDMKKNIFLVQTDKPSRLYKFEDKLIKNDLIGLYDYKEKGYIAQHIYITDNSEIKDGYYLDLTHNIVMKSVFYPSSDKNGKKIILTDNNDLIVDGVQEISEDFLQWFVKNSDCEYVEVICDYIECLEKVEELKDNVGITPRATKLKKIYQTIITSEEPQRGFNIIRNTKEETKQELPQLGTKEFNNLASAYFGGKPQEEPKQYPIGGYAPGNYTCTCITCKERFFGDKRAVQCEPCAIEMVNVKIDINKEGGVEETKPEPNFYEKLKEYFETTPREKVLEDWNKSAHLDNVGPTVDEFLKNSAEERLKDAAERLYPIPFPHKFSNMNQEAYKQREAFIAGVKSDIARDYWFEKFKNK
jgi:hypothetical protein